MQAIKIVDSTAFPSRKRYPFDDLKVGGAFVVEGKELVSSIRSQASKHNRIGRKKFTVQLMCKEARKPGGKPTSKWSIGVTRVK